VPDFENQLFARRLPWLTSQLSAMGLSILQILVKKNTFFLNKFNQRVSYEMRFTVFL